MTDEELCILQKTDNEAFAYEIDPVYRDICEKREAAALLERRQRRLEESPVPAVPSAVALTREQRWAEYGQVAKVTLKAHHKEVTKPIWARLDALESKQASAADAAVAAFESRLAALERENAELKAAKLASDRMYDERLAAQNSKLEKALQLISGLTKHNAALEKKFGEFVGRDKAS